MNEKPYSVVTDPSDGSHYIYVIGNDDWIEHFDHNEPNRAKRTCSLLNSAYSRGRALAETKDGFTVERLCRLIESGTALKAPGLPDGGFKIVAPPGHVLDDAGNVKPASAAPKEGEVERLEPNTFWPDNCEEGEGPSDLELIADGYEVGTVFAVQQAIMLPRGFYVSITDDKGCTDVRPATADEIERFKAAEAERLEEWKRRAKQLPPALSPASEGGGA